MKQRLLEFCGIYLLAPESFDIEGEEALQERYSHLQLRNTSELRLSSLCTESGQPGDDYATMGG